MRNPRHVHVYYLAHLSAVCWYITVRHAAYTRKIHVYVSTCVWARNARSSTQTRLHTRPTRGNFGLAHDGAAADASNGLLGEPVDESREDGGQPRRRRHDP